MSITKFVVTLILATAFMIPSSAMAGRDSSEVMAYIESIINYCADGQWETKECLDVMARMDTLVAANYIAALKQSGQVAQAKAVEDGCAVASKVNYQKMPASAITEAYVLCINSMVDAEAATGIGPHKDYYNMMLMAYFCTSGNQLCPKFESELKKNLR